MAIPTKYDPNQPLFQVRIRQGSGNRCKGRDLDDYRRELTFDKSKAVRAEISALRQQVNARRAAGCMPFFGAYITNEIGRAQLIEFCAQIDKEMKQIDPSLHCTPSFLKIDVAGSPTSNGKSLFDELLGSIRDQVLKTVQARIRREIEKSESKTMTQKKKTALLSMLDHMEDLNLVHDPTVTADLDNMRARINAGQLKELSDDLIQIIDETKDRAGALEIVEPVHKEAEAPAPVPVVKTSGRTLDL